MKRTNLVLNEALLEEATKLLGEKTYSGAVNKALEEVIKLKKARKILNWVGSGIWEGDLEEMRADQLQKKRSK